MIDLVIIKQKNISFISGYENNPNYKRTVKCRLTGAKQSMINIRF